MKRMILMAIFLFFLLLIQHHSVAQSEGKQRKNKAKGMGTQEDLEADFKKGQEEKMTKEDKKNLKKKKKEVEAKRKKDEITRREADRRHNKQMRKDKKKVRAKKKRYVKTH
ncbi:MAG: hypothetical protein NZ529_00820 [Cytophagaceae bacterium]|nr:hypothetical protein [Cytophagaceae bacterium]MDW8455307.1 hypothetical protein [Cytophagaceae bacterium]